MATSQPTLEFMSDTDHSEEPSKSALKREMHQLQKLGQTLLVLKPNQLATVPMTDSLREAIIEGHRIQKHEAKRRHLQRIGRLMRDNDSEAIQQALDLLDPQSALYQLKAKQTEAWLAKLISSQQAEHDWFEQYPSDSQHLRALIRAARKEQRITAEQQATENTPLKSAKNTRKLRQCIREALA